MGRVAILGGTFDPVHWGHLVLAETALSQLNLDVVIWVPAYRPPHKREQRYEHRRSMVEIAIAGNSRFVLEPRKTCHTQTDYAIGTFVDLQDTYPNHQWFWIIGLDAFQTLPRWYRRERLVPACDWLVAPRPYRMPATPTLASTNTNSSQVTDTQANWIGQQVARQLASQDISIRWQLLQMPPLGISSSLIRQYCLQGRSIRYLVPEGVRAYITTHNLYLKAD
ncbi:MAG: nicotinate-nucleotide adenylyltransferase [Coleofasciculaceae cyanobacterium]